MRRANRRLRWRARARSLRGGGGLRILAAAAGGLAVFASFAPSTAWWAAICGFALFGAAARGTSWKSSAGLGVVFGIALYFPLLSWTNVYVGDVPWAGLAGAEALLVAPAAALIGPASRRLPVWPVWGAAAWIGGEVLRSLFPFGGFPWGGVAFTQPDGPLLPIASVLGEAGLAFATVLAGFAAAELVTRAIGLRSMRPITRGTALAIVGLVLLLAAPFVGGLAGRAAMPSTADAPVATVAVIQGNVPEPGLEFNAHRRAVLDNHAKETAALAADIKAGKALQPQIVIWPENASDIDPYRNADAAAEISAAAKDIGVPILVGAVVDAGQSGLSYNR
ncbi:MAG TPA: hypothetical protein VIC62_08445, partial [Nakamurella sp.]